MLIIKPDAMRIPIGGHQFPENGMVIRGESFDEVVQKLTDYRLNNHIHLGNPSRDVLVYYANNWPFMVTDDGKPEPDLSEAKPYEEYRRFIDETWKRPPAKLLATKEASFRWEVCEKCPFNKSKDWPQTKETAELARRSFLMKRGVETPKNLGVCSLHFHADLSILTFVETPAHFVDVKTDAAKPEKCWV